MICGTIDRFVEEIEGKKLTRQDVLGFNPSEFVSKATDYSAYSGLRTQAQVFDQKVGRLQEAIRYADRLVRYANRHAAGMYMCSGVPQGVIRRARNAIQGELDRVIENSRFSNAYRGHSNGHAKRAIGQYHPRKGYEVVHV